MKAGAEKVKPSAEKGTAADAKKSAERRNRVSQGDVPAYGLTEALRIPRAIIENYAGEPSTPLEVAQAMGITPTSSTFKMITGAAIAYGLTEGGYNAPKIAVTKLAERVLTPLEEGDSEVASREALIRPRIVGAFLQKYDGKQLPKAEIAQNVLGSLGCPRDRSADVYDLIMSEASNLGLIVDIKGKQFVKLVGARVRDRQAEEEDAQGGDVDLEEERVDRKPADRSNGVASQLGPTDSSDRDKRVFITHGKDKAFVDPIKRLLAFGEMEPVVSVENQSVSQPVPEKVMADMRSCGGAIIHVAAEMKLIDSDANEHVVLNPNVLIEIGAAMALFGRRFILLVREGVKLPSNLQGLYEGRYAADQLDGDATIRLMEAIRALKATPMPTAQR